MSVDNLTHLARSRPHFLVEAACRAVRASFGGVAFLSAAGEVVESLVWGLPEATAEELPRLPWLRELVHRVVCQSGPTHLADVHSLGEWPRSLSPCGGLLAIPLACPERLRGALYLFRGPDQPAFTDEDEATIRPIASCLEQGSLFEEVHLLAQLRLLNQVARATAGNLGLTPILEVALRELDRHLPMTLCAVWLADEPHETLTGRSAGKEEFLRLSATSAGHGTLARIAGLVPGMYLPVVQTPFAACWRGGGAIFADWAALPLAADAARPALPGAVGNTLTCFATPLRAGDQTLGILQCLTNRPRGITGAQVQILYLIADLLGPAIANCQNHARLRTTYEELRATQEQLIRNEKMRALGEMASGIAHDFNNSLCGVLGFLEVALTDAALSSASRNHLELARTCALDAARTVRRVQDFARNRCRQVLCQPVDVNLLIRETAELTRPKWGSLERVRTGAIALELQTAASVPVLGNAAELREVVTNLVFNAVDAMPRGGTLNLETWSDAANVFLAVRDTGVGMSAGARQRMFEPFFTTKGERGNGLGLSVAFGVVRQHGGEITVASELGQGSAFTIRLPAAGAELPSTVQANPEAGARAPETKSGGNGATLAGLQVLAVEDDAALRQLLETVLTNLGHRPVVVATGGAALNAIAEESFDVVLTDMGLPDVSGEEVARAVAQRRPGTPVVLLTGWADQIQSGAKSLAGVTQVVGKPVSIERLAEVLRAVCPGAHERKALAGASG
jgi:signal transduction histidine kinase/ActR/RegA family two-component response regulator